MNNKKLNINWWWIKSLKVNKKYLIELKNISLTFNSGKTYVLKDISFWVKPWEVVSIIWMNWSWKSSLLKVISWIYKQSSWEVIKNCKKISYVPQKINIDNTFPIKVYEFIKIFNDKIKDENIKNLLKKFWAENLFDKKTSNLSWWEFQKMLIVSSILSNPELIILDEPTAWIDIVWEEKFYELIAETKKIFPNLSIILVSHNINLVYKNSDKVICLHENNFCCHGTPHELQKNDDIKNIFWKLILPYEHHPHKKDEHENI